MISMTGYTKKAFKIKNTSFVILIRSLNSNKGLDVSVKTPRYLFDIEPEIKKIITTHLIRGKIDFKLMESHTDYNMKLDEKKLRNYMQVLSKISPKSDSGQILSSAISLPDIFTSRAFRITATLKKEFLRIIKTSVLDIVKYREKEGRRMGQAIKMYVSNISTKSKQLIKLEKNRVLKKKAKLLKQIKSLSKEINYNPERLETEMIYYFEKYDITEEYEDLRN